MQLRRLLSTAAVAAVAVASLAVGTPALAAAPTTGSIGGTFTAEGVPQSGLGVDVRSTRDGRTFWGGRTDAAGRYSVPQLPVGTYQVMFQYFKETDSQWTQWAHQAHDESTAAVLTVRAGETTVVDETRFPTGSVSVTLRDPATGELVDAFCGDVLTQGFLDSGCTETGTLLLHGLPEGEYLFSMTSAGTGYVFVLGTVTAGRVNDQVVE